MGKWKRISKQSDLTQESQQHQHLWRSPMTTLTMAEVEIGDTWMKLDEVEEEKEIPLIFLEDFNTSIKKFEQEGEFPPQQSDLTQQFQQHQQQIQLHNHQQLRLLQHQVEQPQPTLIHSWIYEEPVTFCNLRNAQPVLSRNRMSTFAGRLVQMLPLQKLCRVNGDKISKEVQHP